MLNAAVPELDFQACQASAVMPQSGALSKAVPGLVCVYLPDEASLYSTDCLEYAHPHSRKVASSTQSHPCLRNVRPSTCSITDSNEWGVSHALSSSSCLSGFNDSSMAARGPDCDGGLAHNNSKMQC